ncbi:FliM/FliN family flagellar motor switch protein [Salmonella enterica]|nr:FliM/FliN family flagellar motor switch protein [Salmonella enterica]EKS5988169.1 FliM/FliN family flagellar motor switch protein [Salmonella enterica]
MGLLISDEQNNVASVLMDIDEWLIEKRLSLPEIPWLQVPLGYIVHWLEKNDLQFLIDEKSWYAQQITIPEQMPKKMLRLPSKPVSLLCSGWPLWNKPQLRSVITHDELTFDLWYVLGYSALSLNTLIDVVVGDIVIIEHICQRIMTGQYVLCGFDYDEQKGVIVKNIVNSDAGFNNENEVKEILFEWNDLPVDVEFVLGKLKITLSELEKLSVGDILPLAVNAEKSIRIYINKKLLAVGELVNIDNGMLAVEITQTSGK